MFQFEYYLKQVKYQKGYCKKAGYLKNNIFYRGGTTCPKLGEQLTLHPKKWVRKIFSFFP